MKRVEDIVGAILTLTVLVGVMAGVLAFTATPASASHNGAPQLERGEVIVCNVGPMPRVRIWEDGSASCVKRSTYRYKYWNGMEVGDYIKCKSAKKVWIDDGFAAHCKRKGDR